MNIRLAVMDMIRGFAHRRGSPGQVENRTYVFIFVPFDSRGNRHASKAHITRGFMDNGSRVDRTRPNVHLSTYAALDGALSRTTSRLDLSDDRELNHDLMWTWFLPNPLWPPNKSNCDLANLFRFGLNGFNENKIRRNN